MLHMTYPRTSRNLQSLPFAVTVEATAAKGVLPPGQHPRCRRPSSLSSSPSSLSWLSRGRRRRRRRGRRLLEADLEKIVTNLLKMFNAPAISPTEVAQKLSHFKQVNLDG